MFEYRNAEYYTEYFRNRSDFKILEEFKESEDKDEKNLYVGSIEVLGTVHPLVIRVEIPITFPHHQLTFRTKSLSGYPHLIHTGKIKYGDWFCLNTPFAETPEEQLNQEIDRLHEWIDRQMNSNLPPFIMDGKVQTALSYASTYGWENPDEVKEFSPKAMLSFVGNFHNDVEYFKEDIGFLHCIRTHDSRFYALSDKTLTNCELPYLIVYQRPVSSEVLSDFNLLKEQYCWDDKVCEHLLPNMGLDGHWENARTSRQNNFSEEDALAQLSLVESELQKENVYLPGESFTGGFSAYRAENSMQLIKVQPSQLKIITDEIQSIRDEVQKFHKFSQFRSLNDEYVTTDGKFDRDNNYEVSDEGEYRNNCDIGELHYFALGIKSCSGIEWFLLFTSHGNGIYDKVIFNLGVVILDIRRVVSYELCCRSSQIISESLFFGRGSLSENFTDKKIAVVGLGAIGSMVVTAMAHSRISKIGLWDQDVVEPGNICRSSYTLKDMGESKAIAMESIVKSINPFISSKQILRHAYWALYGYDPNKAILRHGSFYANVNYNDQEESVNEIKGYDLIIDCTGSNEMLHFLSYAVPDVEIISLCITNHADDLLCISSRDGNPFELRKAYLSRIRQDKEHYYVEGSGCYSPTFLAANCDIAALVNLALRDINKEMGNGRLLHSTVYSYRDRGIVADRLSTYKLDGYDIFLNISSETMFDAEEMSDAPDGEIGYILGCYSRNGRQVMITHIVEAGHAKDALEGAYKTSEGIIDYIGDFKYSGEQPDTFSSSSFQILASKAEDSSINTNNPLLAVRNPDGSISFFLYINGEMVRFRPVPS